MTEAVAVDSQLVVLLLMSSQATFEMACLLSLALEA
jgi:hypothetical protein